MHPPSEALIPGRIHEGNAAVLIFPFLPAWVCLGDSIGGACMSDTFDVDVALNATALHARSEDASSASSMGGSVKGDRGK